MSQVLFYNVVTFKVAMLHVNLVLQYSGPLLSFLTKRVNNSTFIVISHQTCQQQCLYCHFSSNVSTTVPLLSLLTKRVNNSAFIVTSYQTCQQAKLYTSNILHSLIIKKHRLIENSQ